MKKIKAGIIGGAGYTGGELDYLYDVHTDLMGVTEMQFTNHLSEDVDILFLCLNHGDSQKFLSENNIDNGIRIIDLSQDFRMDQKEFVYGLPEMNRSVLSSAKRIANPGCFATAIQLALLPLAKFGYLKGDIHINAITGSTGAGQKPTITTHFSWRHGNISVYKPFQHQHLTEIRYHLGKFNPEHPFTLYFLPYRGSFTRGILAACYLKTDLTFEQAITLYQDFYQTHPFTYISLKNIDVKQVVNTNNCFLHLEKHNDQLLIISIIDNLLKGASGQAVQNMNIMFGLKETAGLKFKSVVF